MSKIIGKVQAKRKGWKQWGEDNQVVRGYMLVIDDRYFIYQKAEIGSYGTITIREYVEIEPNTITECEETPHKINHNSLCETETCKADGTNGK